MSTEPPIEVRNLELGYGTRVVLQDLNFEVRPSEVFVIMGGSGCGKSTLLRSLLGLQPFRNGQILYHGCDFATTPPKARAALTRRFGVSFQGGALWSSLTLAENVALPLQRFTNLPPEEVQRRVQLKLAWVGLAGFEDYLPAAISGGMAKRAALARALSLDPELLFFDEPSAGLDPISSRRLDDLILQIRDASGTTVIVVTHELHSINAIADRALFLSAGRRTQTAVGRLPELRESADPEVRAFLARSELKPANPVRSPSPNPANHPSNISRP